MTDIKEITDDELRAACKAAAARIQDHPRHRAVRALLHYHLVGDDTFWDGDGYGREGDKVVHLPQESRASFVADLDLIPVWSVRLQRAKWAAIQRCSDNDRVSRLIEKYNGQDDPTPGAPFAYHYDPDHDPYSDAVWNGADTDADDPGFPPWAKLDDIQYVPVDRRAALVEELDWMKREPGCWSCRFWHVEYSNFRRQTLTPGRTECRRHPPMVHGYTETTRDDEGEKIKTLHTETHYPKVRSTQWCGHHEDKPA